MAPNFRRGVHPSWFGFTKVEYKGVDPERLEKAWQGLCSCGGAIGAPIIANWMGLSEKNATRYLRALEILGFLVWTRGVYDPEPYDPNSSGNLPSRVTLLARDPLAVATWWAKAEADLGRFRMLVASRDHDALDHDWSSARFARGVRASAATVWADQEGAVLGREFVSPWVITTKNPVVTQFDTNAEPPWVPVQPPTTVVLVPSPVQPPGRTPPSEARSAISRDPTPHATPEQQTPGPEQKVVTPGDVMARWGCSRMTAYRYLKAWRATPVSRGRWAVDASRW